MGNLSRPRAVVTGIAGQDGSHLTKLPRGQPGHEGER